MKPVMLSVVGILAACAATPDAEPVAFTGPATEEAAIENEVLVADKEPVSGVQMVVSPTVKIIKAKDAPRSDSHVNSEGQKIVCKTDNATGSRIKKNRVCGTELEWSRAGDQVQRWVGQQGSMMSGGHGQPGG